MILSYRDTSGRHYYDLLSLLRDPWSTPNPAVTKQRRWKHFTLHHTRVFIMSLSSAHAPHTVCPLSISRIVLIRRLKPETRCFHTWLLRVSVLRQKEIRQGGNHLIFFSFFPLWPFKSTLQPTLLWPLMYAVHLARQSCETQDHRHGLKQFHPLIEPISSSHRKKGNQVRLTVKYSRSKLKKKKLATNFYLCFLFLKIRDIDQYFFISFSVFLGT